MSPETFLPTIFTPGESFFRKFRTLERDADGYGKYFYTEPYTDRGVFASHLPRITETEGFDNLSVCLCLIPGVPDNRNSIHTIFFELSYHEYLDGKRNYVIDVGTMGDTEYGSTMYYHQYRNDNPRRVYMYGSVQHQIYNYDIRKLPQDVYQLEQLPERIDIAATAEGFINNIRQGNFSLPELVSL